MTVDINATVKSQRTKPTNHTKSTNKRTHMSYKPTNTNSHKIRRRKIYFTPTAEICNDSRENAEFDYNLGNSFFDYT